MEKWLAKRDSMLKVGIMSKNNNLSPPDDRFKGVIQTPRVAVHQLKDDGTIPNNDKLPLLVYQGALSLPDQNPAAVVEALFRANQWGGSWRDGIYGFHHYHSTAHEVLAICRGKAKVQLGGENGIWKGFLEWQHGRIARRDAQTQWIDHR